MASASGGFTGAIVLYETALGLGIAVGPLLGGVLGEISWRGPFYGVAALMAIALIATIVLVQPTPLPARKTSLSAPLRALRHRGLLTMSLTALCYNWGFFTVLGYAPFPMNLSPIKLGLVFTGWGLMVAIFAVFGAPRLQARFGIAATMYANLAAFAAIIVVIAVWTTNRDVLIPAVIVSGIFIGINNTITTQAVMTIAPVERPVASAAYSFVRFIGGGLAPYAAGLLVLAVNIHFPFYLGAGAVVLGIVILTTVHKALGAAERAQAEEVRAAVTSGSSEGTAGAPATGPARLPVTAEGGAGPVTPGIVTTGTVTTGTGAAGPLPGAIVAAVDDSPVAGLVITAAARLAGSLGRTVHVVHVPEAVIGGDTAVDGESQDAAAALVGRYLRELAARDVAAQGQLLLHAGDHGAAGRLIAEYAREVGATTIVIGAPRHGGLATLMDASTSQALLRAARTHVLIVNPDAPAAPASTVRDEAERQLVS